MEDRYAATLVGCAIGDSLGMPVEGWKREQIKKYLGRVTELISPFILSDEDGDIIAEDEFGKIRYWTAELKKGDYTDDTILTLAIAKSIAENGLNLYDSSKKQLEAFKANKDSGFGKTTVEAFENLEKGISPLNSGVNGIGNAPAMKMSPVGMYMHATGKYEEGLTFAGLVGKSTHLDSRSIAGGIVQAHSIYAILSDFSKKDFLESTIKICENYEPPLSENAIAKEKGPLKEKLRWILENSDTDCETAFNYLGNSGMAVESHPFALFMFQKYWNSSLEGLIETINYGGDCDTTGAIYGTLCGAKNGMIFPEKWLAVRNIEEIIYIGKKLSTLKNGK